MRANVLLPTATLPATPITYGTRGANVPRNVDDTLARSCGRADVEVEQTGQREVDRGHLVEVDALVDPAQLLQVGFAQRHRRRRPESRPVVAPDRDEPGGRLLHQADPRLGSWPRCNPRPTRDAEAARRVRDAIRAGGALVANTLPALRPGQRVTVLDPACGDGRFLTAAAARIGAAGAVPLVTGVDIDGDAVRTAQRAVAARPGCVRSPDPAGRRARTTIGATSASTSCSATHRSSPSSRPARRGAGRAVTAAVRTPTPRPSSSPSLCASARPGGGRVGLVLPQSMLASRDAAEVRSEVDRRAELIWSWWSPRRVFDAQVFVCALAFEVGGAAVNGHRHRPWSRVVADALGVPALPPLAASGTLGARGRLSANFRDQYYGLVPAVDDHAAGPPLVTSGLIDPGRCRWGEREVIFARRRLARPRVDREATRARRCVAGPTASPFPRCSSPTRRGSSRLWPIPRAGGFPACPLITVRAPVPADVWAIAAVLTSAPASAWAWHRAAGTGLSARTLRLGPRWLADLPWPAGSVVPAVEALRDGDVVACGSAVAHAFGVDAADAAVLEQWWRARLSHG